MKAIVWMAIAACCADSTLVQAQTSPDKGMVMVLDTAMTMPELAPRTRRIWVYLPTGYDQTKKKYPVLYMHDGQNLFDARYAFAGEWGIDEISDSMRSRYIVVGIDNGGQKRMQEYNVEDHERFGKGEGEAYLQFIVNQLKPFIDQRFRTKSDKKHTAIAGSSMGGLISYYAGIQYPHVFGRIGVFSPSFWIVRDLKSSWSQAKVSKSQLWFFYAGGKEGETMVPLTKEVEQQIAQQFKAKTYLEINPDGRHQESAWRQAFPAFLSRIQ